MIYLSRILQIDGSKNNLAMDDSSEFKENNFLTAITVM